MVENRLFFFIHISILFLIILSSCTAYEVFRHKTGLVRPIKYHILIDPSRYTDRTREYHDTLAKLRFWRRYINEFDEDNTGSQEILRNYKYSEYNKR
ncbi:unnamed protein product [Rotaria sordida]|uniref:Uncharacterized protein n=1 Tax=Rotaria sordida TaxID=392033 RepID=A0A815VDP9_9BILA|nr:unnamed protein product [Rotaria sordida]CAF1526833.1 unnamed protein product [Rotaria sordida]